MPRRTHCDCNDCEAEYREWLEHPAAFDEPSAGPGWGAGRRGVSAIVAAAQHYAHAAAFRRQEDDHPEGPAERRANEDEALRRLGAAAWAWRGWIAAAPVAREAPAPHWSAADRAVSALAAAALRYADAAERRSPADAAAALRALADAAWERRSDLAVAQIPIEYAPFTTFDEGFADPGGEDGEEPDFASGPAAA